MKLRNVLPCNGPVHGFSKITLSRSISVHHRIKVRTDWRTLQISWIYRSFGNLISQIILFIYFVAWFLSKFQNALSENFKISRFPIAAKVRLLEELSRSLHWRFTKKFFQGKFRWKYESWIQWYFIIQLECSTETIPISLLFSCENWDFYAVKCAWDWKTRKHSKYEMNLISAVKWRHGLFIEPGGYEWKDRVEFKLYRWSQ